MVSEAWTRMTVLEARFRNQDLTQQQLCTDSASHNSDLRQSHPLAIGSCLHQVYS